MHVLLWHHKMLQNGALRELMPGLRDSRRALLLTAEGISANLARPGSHAVRHEGRRLLRRAHLQTPTPREPRQNSNAVFPHST
jgi:hypothetical protein